MAARPAAGTARGAGGDEQGARRAACAATKRGSESVARHGRHTARKRAAALAGAQQHLAHHVLRHQGRDAATAIAGGRHPSLPPSTRSRLSRRRRHR